MPCTEEVWKNLYMRRLPCYRSFSYRADLSQSNTQSRHLSVLRHSFFPGWDSTSTWALVEIWEKCVFVIFLGSPNCLPDEKMALKKALPDRNLALKITYRMGIWLSKSLTGRESGHQIFLPDMIYLSGKIYDYFDYAWVGVEWGWALNWLRNIYTLPK